MIAPTGAFRVMKQGLEEALAYAEMQMALKDARGTEKTLRTQLDVLRRQRDEADLARQEAEKELKKITGTHTTELTPREVSYK